MANLDEYEPKTKKKQTRLLTFGLTKSAHGFVKFALVQI